jgi:hypothetical protein
MPNYALFQTVWVGLLFVSVQSKHRNSLFRYRSETTGTNCFETNRKIRKNRKTLNFLKKQTKYTPYQTVSVGLLFVSVQPKHRNSVSVYCRSETTETNFLIRLFRIETSFKGHHSLNAVPDSKMKSSFPHPDSFGSVYLDP